MKKIFAILLGAVILMSAVSCSDEKNNDTSVKENEPEVSVSAEAESEDSENTEGTEETAEADESETEENEEVKESDETEAVDEGSEEESEEKSEDDNKDEKKEEAEKTEETASEEKAEEKKEEKEPTVVEIPKEDKVLKEVLPVTGYDATKMMDSIMSVFPGSAGSSLRTYIAAFEVLNLSERYNDGDKQAVEEALAMHVAALPDFSIDNMKETVAEIDTIASKVFSDGVEALSAELSDVGNPNEYDSYSKANYDKVIKLIKTALGM